MAVTIIFAFSFIMKHEIQVNEQLEYISSLITMPPSLQLFNSRWTDEDGKLTFASILCL